MSREMLLKVWDVAHGACIMLHHRENGVAGRLAMIDSGCSAEWRPSQYIKNVLKRDRIDYLYITNADQDHMSDLHRLSDEGISVGSFGRNRSYTGAQIAEIKRKSGPLSKDAQWYASACDSYCQPVSVPFNEGMGGIKRYAFCNSYPAFEDTNDLSCAVFIEYAGVKFLFPGDLENAGWRELLKNEAFRNHLSTTHILMASHHGRQSGFCPEVFSICQPLVVLISDKPIAHETQKTTPDYRNIVQGDGVNIFNTKTKRRVLTTRNDGSILFIVNEDGGFEIHTECG